MRIALLNIFVDNLTMSEAIDSINALIKNQDRSYVVTPNLDHIVIIEKDPEFKTIYDNASLILADGKPLLWLSKIFGTPIKEKVSGSDLFPELCDLAARENYRVFILGAEEGVADTAAAVLVQKYPNLQIAGTYSPPIGFEKNAIEVHRIVSMINDARSDILGVALGSPKGEKFIYQVKDELNVRLSISIGATIDFIAGKVKRAPAWVSNAGLEWLFRIFQDPKRLFKRYWMDAISIIPIIKKYRKV